MRVSLSQETLNDFLFVKESMGLVASFDRRQNCKIHCKMDDIEEGSKTFRWWKILVPICLYCSNFKLRENVVS